MDKHEIKKLKRKMFHLGFRKTGILVKTETNWKQVYSDEFCLSVEGGDLFFGYFLVRFRKPVRYWNVCRCYRLKKEEIKIHLVVYCNRRLTMGTVDELEITSPPDLKKKMEELVVETKLFAEIDKLIFLEEIRKVFERLQKRKVSQNGKKEYLEKVS